jgi:hypothetical protein
MRPGSFSATVTSDGAGGSRQTEGYRCPFPLSEEELNERKKSANRATKNLASGLAAVGLLISGVVAAAAYSEEAGVEASLYAFLASILVTLLVTCLAMVGYWMLSEQDSRQIPTDPIYFPEIIEPWRDEIWRAPMPLTYLESLKTQLTSYEETAMNLSSDAVNAYNAISSIRSYGDYESIIKRLDALKSFKRDYDRVVPQLKERAKRVFGGQVIEEVNALQADIKKLKRERQELEESQAKRKEEEVVRRNERRTVAAAWAATVGSQIKSTIKDIDLMIISKEAAISELRHFDFKRLYKELGLSEDWPATLISIAELEEIKAKSDVIGAIKKLTELAKPEASADEERAQNRTDCQQRLNSLQQDKETDLSKMRDSGRTEEEIKRRENMWDDAVVREEEELRKWL